MDFKLLDFVDLLLQEIPLPSHPDFYPGFDLLSRLFFKEQESHVPLAVAYHKLPKPGHNLSVFVLFPKSHEVYSFHFLIEVVCFITGENRLDLRIPVCIFLAFLGEIDEIKFPLSGHCQGTVFVDHRTPIYLLPERGLKFTKILGLKPMRLLDVLLVIETTVNQSVARADVAKTLSFGREFEHGLWLPVSKIGEVGLLQSGLREIVPLDSSGLVGVAEHLGCRVVVDD